MPVPDAAPLWAGRLGLAPSRWPATPFRLIVAPLAPHRRRYLHYQGPLTRGRGCVRRVEQGTITPGLWRLGRAELTLHLHQWTGRVALHMLTNDRIAATFYPDHPLKPRVSNARITLPRR